MSDGAAVGRYAQAILELAQSEGQTEAVLAGLRDMAAMYTASDDLRRAVHNPVLSESDREGLLGRIAREAQLPELGRRCLLVLARRRRLALLPALSQQLQRLADESTGVCRATITSAGSLSESFFAELRGKLEHGLARRVVLEHKEDPRLIGGLIAQVGDNVFDGSLLGRLEQLEKSLLASV